MRIVKIMISPALEGRTVRALLSTELHCSAALLKRLKRRPGSILLNGVPVSRVDMRVTAGDLLAADVDDDLPIPDGLTCGIPIVYEDEDLLVLNKPAGMAVHAAGMTALAGTVAEAVCTYLGGRALHCVNRLDRGTSGLMVVAKNGYVHELMRRILHTDALVREYHAIALGEVSPPSGAIDLPIARERESAVRRCIDPEGFPSRTRYETLAVGGGYTYLRVIPETGRTHQIRVHMAAIGYPLVGDWLYGIEDQQLITRPALHSYSLDMTSPVVGKRVFLSAPLPADMAALINIMR